MPETGKLGLLLEADLAQWNAAFAKAGTGAQVLAKEVAVATGGMSSAEKEAAKLGKQMEQAAKNASALNSIKWSQLLQGLQAATGLLTRFVTQGVEMAKFSTEFARLENAIPAKKMAELAAETQGTVSKFDLLTRAAKEMSLSSTAGMDATVLAGKQTLALWENYVDAAKRGLGGIVLAALDGLDRLSDKLADVDRRLQKGATPGQVAAANAERSTDVTLLRRAGASDSRLAGQADFLERGQPITARAQEVIERDTAEWRREYRVQLAIASRRALDGVLAEGLQTARGANSMAELAGAGGTLLDSFRRPLQSALGPRTNILDIFGGKSGGGGRGGPGFFGGVIGAANQYVGARQPGVFDQVGSGFGNLWGGAGTGATGTAALGGVLGTAGRDLGQAFGSAGSGLGKQLGIGGDQGASERLKALNDNTTALGASFEALAGGLSAAVEAAISGNEAIGKAFLKGAAAVLKGVALKAIGLAAFEGAMAWVEPPLAAVHLTAMAKLLGAAAIAGGLSAGAAGLAGGGGGGASAGASPSTAAGGGGIRDHTSGGGGGGSPINIYIGEGYVGKPAELGAAIAEQVRRAQNAGTVRILPGAAVVKN